MNNLLVSTSCCPTCAPLHDTAGSSSRSLDMKHTIPTVEINWLVQTDTRLMKAANYSINNSKHYSKNNYTKHTGLDKTQPLYLAFFILCSLVWKSRVDTHTHTVVHNTQYHLSWNWILFSYFSSFLFLWMKCFSKILHGGNKRAGVNIIYLHLLKIVYQWVFKSMV